MLLSPSTAQSALASVIPRSQPAVRATALACLVLRRSYVSNSASPAADWGLKVILQPPYRQRTSLAAAVPPTHWIASRKSHSEGTLNVLARYLQRAFVVPPATCPYGGVWVCTSVARRRCVEGTTHVRHTHGHILPAQSIYSELSTGIPEKFIFNLTKHGKKTSVNMAWYPRRLGLLRLHLVAQGQRRNNNIMALIIRERQRLQEERRVRQYWVRPWIERRRLFGQYHTLFQELERESHGDYQAYIRPYPSCWVPSPRWVDDNAWD